MLAEFAADPELGLLQVAVYDFFTDQLIFGQHNYRNTIRWDTRTDQLFTDKQTTSQKRVNDSSKLAPAAFHCPDPSPFQAFHFGVHKAVKVMQVGAANKRVEPRNIHWDNFLRTRAHFKRNDDIRLGYAVLGAEIAFKQRFTYRQVDYGDRLLQQHFSAVKNLSLPEVKQTIWAHTIFKRFPSFVRLALVSLLSEQKAMINIPLSTYYMVLKNTVKRLFEENNDVVR